MLNDATQSICQTSIDSLYFLKQGIIRKDEHGSTWMNKLLTKFITFR